MQAGIWPEVCMSSDMLPQHAGFLASDSTLGTDLEINVKLDEN